MIKVNYLQNKELREWYRKEIFAKIMKVKLPSIITKSGTIWIKILSDERFLCDILFEPLSLLLRRYKWITRYMKCSKMRKRLDNCIISHYINPNFLNGLKHELMKRMDIKICPYCNQQYIYAISFDDNDIKYLGDIDHVLPKTQYGLFALSLWNLVPSCKSCNQSFKGRKKVDILLPTEDGFGDDCIFRIDFQLVEAMMGESDNFDVYWETRPQGYNKNKIDKIEQNLEVFKLNELYKVHKQEIKSLLRRKRICYSGIYRGIKIIPAKSENDLLDFWFGEYLDEANYTLYTHAKMIHDILLKN